MPDAYTMEMETHRCLQCDAPVVDRRSPRCTTCHAELPVEWIMTPEQIAKVTMMDQHAEAEHAVAMSDLDPENDPNAPVLTQLDSDLTETS